MTTNPPAFAALTSALLDAVAAELNKIPRLTLPMLMQCGGEFAVFVRDPHDGRRGKRNRYAWRYMLCGISQFIARRLP